MSLTEPIVIADKWHLQAVHTAFRLLCRSAGQSRPCESRLTACCQRDTQIRHRQAAQPDKAGTGKLVCCTLHRGVCCQGELLLCAYCCGGTKG